MLYLNTAAPQRCYCWSCEVAAKGKAQGGRRSEGTEVKEAELRPGGAGGGGGRGGGGAAWGGGAKVNISPLRS